MQNDVRIGRLTISRKKLIIAAVVGAAAALAAVLLLFLMPRTLDIEVVDAWDVDEFEVVRHGVPPIGAAAPTRLTIGADSVMGIINPLASMTQADMLASSLIFEPLMKLGPGGVVLPWLLDSFELSYDGMTYTLGLSTNVYFSDGSPLTVQCIAQSFHMFSDIVIDNPYTRHLTSIIGFNEFRLGMSHSIYGITADPYYNTIAFTFAYPAMSNINAFLTPIIRDNIGTGPYYLASTGDAHIDLAANPHHHRGMPQIPHVRIISAHASAVPALFAVGALDLFWTDYLPGMLSHIEDMPQVSIGVFEGNVTGYVGFNAQSSTLSNPRLREALTLAVDAAQIAYDAHGLFAAPSVRVVPDNFWLKNTTPFAHGHNPERAAEILEEEGFVRNAAGFFGRDGQELSLHLYTINTESALRTSEAAARAWRDFGVRVIVQTLSLSNLRHMIESGDFDMLYLTKRILHDTDFSSFTNPSVFVNPFRRSCAESDRLVPLMNVPDIYSAQQAFGEWLYLYESSFAGLHIDRAKQLVFFSPWLMGLNPFGHGSFTWNIESWYFGDGVRDDAAEQDG